MASVRKEIDIAAPAAQVWDALRDVGALHTRLVPGFVLDTKLETDPPARVVTFGNGVVARELIVSVDDTERRLVWSVVGGSFTHHNAAAQVFDTGSGRCRFVWIADVLPDAAAAHVAGLMDHAVQTIRRTQESAAAR